MFILHNLNPSVRRDLCTRDTRLRPTYDNSINSTRGDKKTKTEYITRPVYREGGNFTAHCRKTYRVRCNNSENSRRNITYPGLYER